MPASAPSPCHRGRGTRSPSRYLVRGVDLVLGLVQSGFTAEPGNEGGGSIEVFADGADAQVRSDYIQETLQSLGPIAGTEYHYLAGPILVRATGELPPSVAAEYETAVAGSS
jgi:hypothetical protein